MGKRLLIIFLILFVSNLFAGDYSGGTGTSGDPYQIATTDDLIELSTTSGDWGAYFIQTADIEFNADETQVDWDGDGSADWDTEDQKGFSPIGEAGFDDNFIGSYDGNEKTISNLFINRPSDDYIGLFGNTDVGATISNIGVTNVDITALSDVGGLVGWNSGGNVSYSYTTGSVHAEYPDYGGYNVGGIAGVNSATISNSYSTVSVSGHDVIGGLVGNNDYGTISKCYAAGSVSGTGSDISGLVGSGLSDDVDDSFWDKETSGQSSSDGGTGKITAEMKDVATFTDVTNTTGLDNAWDFVGNPNDDNADNDYWAMSSSITFNGYPTLQWTGTYSVEPSQSGGVYQITSLPNLVWIAEDNTRWGNDYEQTADIDAWTTPSWDDGKGFSPIGNDGNEFTGIYDGQGYSINNLYINRPATDYVGLFGDVDNDNATPLINIHLQDIDIEGNSRVGGIVGNISYGSIQSCSVTGKNNIKGNSYRVGGIAGFIFDDDIKNSRAEVTVISNSRQVGGLAGHMTNGDAENCSSSGTVSAEDYYVGGLLGANGGNIKNCYSSADVSGSYKVGGLVGNFDDAWEISNCYSTGDVTRISSSTETSIGAFVGYNEDAINNCYSTGNVIYEEATNPTDKGFVGEDYTGTYTDNFFDSESFNQTTATGATSKTTAEMKDVATFTDVSTVGLDAAWDFVTNPNDDTANNDYWDMDQLGTVNNGYPILSWQDGADQTLPVELSSFTVAFTNNSPVLNWTTQSEDNNQGWNIYRSLEETETGVQINYQMIPGAGTTSEPTNYNYTDAYNLLPETEYFYWLETIKNNGETQLYGPVSLVIPENQEDPDAPDIPMKYGLNNYPNPFNPSTTISFALKQSSPVKLTIYNLRGRKIRTLVAGQTYSKDKTHSVVWDGKDTAGIEVGSGIYLSKLITKYKTYTGKMLLLE